MEALITAFSYVLYAIAAYIALPIAIIILFLLFSAVVLIALAILSGIIAVYESVKERQTKKLLRRVK